MISTIHDALMSKALYFILFFGICHLAILNRASAQVETILDAPETAEIGSWFGLSVAASEEAAIVGAGAEDGTGAAYIYEQVGGTWTFVQRIVSSDLAIGDEFGGKMAMSGSRAIIAARYDDGNSGSAYIFDRIDGTWVESAKLVSNDLESGDNFGAQVAIDNDRAVVGARREDTGGNDAGAAYVFDLQNGSWNQVAKLQPNDVAAGDWFGKGVSVSGDRVMVGGGNAAYMFELQNGSWNQTQKISSADASENRFATSVSIDGERAVAAGSGVISLYDYDGASWNLTALLTPTSSEGVQVFGRRVLLSGDRVISGAQLSGNDEFDSSGSAFVFELQAGTWSQVYELIASDRQSFDKFGSSVYIAGSIAVVGAPGLSFTATEQSSAYIYELISGPIASFTYVVDDMTVDFDGSSSSVSGGDIVTWDWDFGDGNTGSGELITHTYASAGSYTVVLTVTDDEGANGTTSQSVTVEEITAGNTMHVESISTVVIKSGGASGFVEATILIVDENAVPVDGATVSGIFSEDVSGSHTAITDAVGEVVLISDTITSKPQNIGICVDSVTHVSFTYDPAANSDPSYACSGVAPSKKSLFLGAQQSLLQFFPTEFALNANYPNPFNPTTNIKFDLPVASDVLLEVYDIMGRRVATLASGYFAAGRHEVTWHATSDAGASVASGVYLYNIHAGGYASVKRMVLMR